MIIEIGDFNPRATCGLSPDGYHFFAYSNGLIVCRYCGLSPAHSTGTTTTTSISVPGIDTTTIWNGDQ